MNGTSLFLLFFKKILVEILDFEPEISVLHGQTQELSFILQNSNLRIYMNFTHEEKATLALFDDVMYATTPVF